MINTLKVDSAYQIYMHGRYSFMVLSKKYIYASALGPNSTKEAACCDVARVNFAEWANTSFVERVLEQFKSTTGLQPIIEVDDGGETRYDGFYIHIKFVMALAEWTGNAEFKRAVKEIIHKINHS